MVCTTSKTSQKLYIIFSCEKRTHNEINQKPLPINFTSVPSKPHTIFLCLMLIKSVFKVHEFPVLLNKSVNLVQYAPCKNVSKTVSSYRQTSVVSHSGSGWMVFTFFSVEHFMALQFGRIMQNKKSAGRNTYLKFHITINLLAIVVFLFTISAISISFASTYSC